MSDQKTNIPATSKSLPIVRLCVLLLVLTTILAYQNSFFGPFVMDDRHNILMNSSIRSLLPLSKAFSPPYGCGISGRPLINFTLALNYAISGYNVWSYHALNLIIHIGAGLALFGVIRRTLSSWGLAARFGRHSSWLALACSMVWMLHPVQTESVTYTIQRCESLMGMCFLLTVYCSIRGWQSTKPRPWHLAAILSCLAGCGSKEVIVAAPLLVFIYDLTFVHQGVFDTLRRSRMLYPGLLLCMVGLFLLVAQGGTNSTITPKLGFTWYEYAITQPEVILTYLKLIFWPHPLTFSYYWPVADIGDAWLPILIVLILLSISIWSLFKRHPASFPAIWFWACLAPTSSFLPITDLAFEHRLYLSLAGPVVLVIVSGYHYAILWLPRRLKSPDKKFMYAGLLFIVFAWASILGAMTFLRNEQYGDAVVLWTDTVQKAPKCARAYSCLSLQLVQRGRYEEALHYQLEEARLLPESASARDAIGSILISLGRYEEAVGYLEEALKLKPDYYNANHNLGIAYMAAGNPEKAIVQLHKALRLKPLNFFSRISLAIALNKAGQPQKSMAQLEILLKNFPGDPRVIDLMDKIRKQEAS